MDDKALDRLFTGDLDQLVPLPKRVVRLFISSTFTDMMLERNSLMERVYPRLKKYCRERHGLDFQVVDMRWGVRDEATDDHQTANLCSREIDNCQRMSLGPNFVALIGDKYGFRPLCNKIKSSEYRALRRCLIELDMSTDFLDTWYKEDLNAVPAEYLLQPISSILKNFTNKNEPDLQSLDQRSWQAIQQRLHELLMIGSSRLVEQGRMSEQEQLMKYSISVTEREVIEGCLNVKEAKSNCLVYVRSIVDIREQLSRCLDSMLSPVSPQSDTSQPNNIIIGAEGLGPREAEEKITAAATNNSVTTDLKDRGTSSPSSSSAMDTIIQRTPATTTTATTTTATKFGSGGGSGAGRNEQRRLERTRNLLAKYIDLSSRGQNVWSLDNEAQTLLAHLRAVKLENKMYNSRALSRNKLLWDDQEGISLKSEEHRRYLNELTDHFYMNMTKMIRRASRDDQEFKAGLIGEVLQHSHYARHVSKSFYGRSNELDRIRSYLLNPIAISGSSRTFSATTTTGNGSVMMNDSMGAEPMPMFVYGVGGSGKTSVLAKAATMAKDWIERAKSLSGSGGGGSGSGGGQAQEDERWDQRPCIIMRFCCTTPSSSSMVGVLTSVCRQLQYNLYQFGPLNSFMNHETESGGRASNAGSEPTAAAAHSNSNSSPNSTTNLNLNNKIEPQLPYEPIPEDFVRLVFTFRQLIENCRHHYHKNRLFLIILDSVERLTSPAESSVEVKYSWLTGFTKLPSNVRLIVSCSSERLAELSSSSPADRAGGSEVDFIHLKRNFLRLYLPLFKKHADETNDKDLHSLTWGQLDLHQSGNLRLAHTDSSMDAAVAAMDSGEQRQQLGGNRSPRDSLAGHLLKRLVLPAMRIRRSSQRLLAPDLPQAPNSELAADSTIRRHSLKRSATSLSIIKSTSQVGNKKRANYSYNSSRNNDNKDEPASSGPGPDQPKGRSPSLGSRLSCSSRLGSGAPPASSTPDTETSNAQAGDLGQVDKSQRATSRKTLRRGPGVNMIHVRPMGVDLALNVVRLWLQEIGRTLTQQQWSIARRSFAQCSRPIFVKLTFGEIVNWKSYSVQSDSKGLTFGSSILEGNGGGDGTVKALMANSADTDPQLRLLMDHCEWPASSNPQFKRQILIMEREWLGYLGYSKRRAEPASGPVGETSGSGELAATGGVVPRSWNGGLALTSNICHLSSTIDEAISQLFARIELQHGYLLTKHSLSYITAARNGICENELEDILSLDDVVLDDVFQYHFPPVRRIPPLLWTRIRNDLTDYLSERDADGIVVNWHHHQFKLVAQSRYLNELRQLYYVHSNLADYFMGRWADVPKPFSCTRQQMLAATEQLDQQARGDSGTPSSPTTGTSLSGGGRLGGGAGSGGGSGSGGGGVSGSASGRSGPGGSGGRSSSRLRSSGQSDKSTNWRQAKADRRVPHQPIYYDTTISSTATSSAAVGKQRSSLEEKLAGGQSDVPRRRYNLRKLTELPYHLMRSRRFVDLANEVLFNYKWLYAAIEATGLQSLLTDFDEASRCLEAALSERMEARDGENLQQQHEATRLESTYPSRRKADFDADTLRSMISQLDILNNTIRLSSSSIHSDTQMLAPQLIARLLPLTRTTGGDKQLVAQVGAAKQDRQINYLIKLLDQCDRDGCLDCALLPTDHCLQAPNGLQLSSLEGHSFAILSMGMAADQRHLLAVSNRFIMWDITTGEVSRDVDPKCEGSIMMELRMGLNDEYAIAYTSNNVILVLDILTQQVVKLNLLTIEWDKSNKNHQLSMETANAADGDEKIIGLELVDLIGATKFVVWTRKRWFIMRIDKNEHMRSASMPQRISIELDHCVQLSSLCSHEQPGNDANNLDNRLSSSSSHVNIQQVSHDSGSNLSFVLVKNSLDQSGKLHLITVAHTCDRNNHQNPLDMMWEKHIEAASLCLDPSQKQLVFSNHQGDVFLTRRRHSHWSRPKLICSSSESNSAPPAMDVAGDKVSMVYPVPLAIDLNCNRGYNPIQRKATDADNSAEIYAFEEKVDGAQVEDELNVSALLSKHKSGQLNQANSSSSLHQGSRGPGYLKTVLIYLNDRIIVLRLDSKREKSLMLPRDIRNISVEPNRCQIRAIILGAAHNPNSEGFLAAAVGRRLLLYSIGGCQFLRCIDAHAGRIVQLMPIVCQMSSDNYCIEQSSSPPSHLDSDDDRWLSFASASLDKTVKIWNLTNLEKDIHTLDKLDNPIESMSLARQRPWVACLGRSELGLWDWRTMRLLARLSQHDLAIITKIHPKDHGGGNQHHHYKDHGQPAIGSRLLKCRLSSDGRHLCLATLKSIHLFVVEKIPTAESGCEYQLKACAEHQLPDEAVVRQFRFFQQDSKMLTTVECPMISHQALTNTTAPRRMSGDETASISSGGASSQTATARRIHILCHSIPDGRLLYTIASITPTINQQNPTGAAAAAAASSHHKLDAYRARDNSNRIRLPVLTRDQLYVVTVESGSGSVSPSDHHHQQQQQASSATILRKRSSGARLTTILGVYSARDGLFLRHINLDQLEPYNLRPGEELEPLRNGALGQQRQQQQQHKELSSDGLFNLSVELRSRHNGGGGGSGSGGQVCSVGGDQFSRLKSVASYRERQSVVALLDDERSSSFLVDVNTRQLMASSSIWNGKLSANGRFGLSRMFKSATATGSLRATATLSSSASPATASQTSTSPATSTTTTTAGLQLLEMGHCKPVKTLLTHETLSKLSSLRRGETRIGPTTGNDTDITCGFAGPNDSHVYYHDSRLAKLLLLRVGDGHLVANYKLSTRVTKIKCSSDGYALVLGLADGSLTSLAIVDPQKDDTVVRLAQYPSRSRDNTP